MSRKEHIKKSLGITEYPWSSDEEDPASVPTIPEIMRRASEPRPSVAEMPGTSGQPAPSSPTLSPARRSGNKVDKDLILSILRNPHTHNMTPLEIVRSLRTDGAAPKAYVSSPLSWPSVVHTPAAELREARAERPNPTMDLARMVPFKRIARTISTIRSSKSNSNLYAMSSRGQRNPIFTPADMSGYRVGGRTPSALKRLQAERNSRRWDLLASKPLSTHHPQPEEPATSVAPVAPTPRDGFVPTQPSLREFMREAMQIPTPEQPPAPAPPPPDAAWMDETVVVDEASPNDQNDDVMELPDNVGSPQPIVDEAADPEPIDVDTSHNSSGAGVSLEEEIVEIDAPDDVDADVNVTGDGDDNPENVVTSDVGLNEAAAAPTNDDTVVLHQQSHESNKRRRDGHASAEEGEPYTVKEFNQSLLRLLECPVCLEWMEPPMSQCRRGHLVCSRCRARLASCPVCRTTFSSVRNRAMEGVAEMVRYPCRHGCGREVRLRRRAGHEASCGARRYHCPAPACADRPPLPRDHLHQHFQGKHMSMLKIGRKHKFSMKVNSEQHDTWLITALHEYFYLRVDVDIRTWGVIVYVAYIGPKCNAKNFTYEVSVVGQHNSRKLVYARVTHSDLESSNLNVSRQDCFHLTLDQALNFLRFKNRHCEPDKFLDFNVEINKSEPSETRDDSDS